MGESQTVELKKFNDATDLIEENMKPINDIKGKTKMLLDEKEKLISTLTSLNDNQTSDLEELQDLYTTLRVEMDQVEKEEDEKDEDEKDIYTNLREEMDDSEEAENEFRNPKEE